MLNPLIEAVFSQITSVEEARAEVAKRAQELDKTLTSISNSIGEQKELAREAQRIFIQGGISREMLEKILHRLPPRFFPYAISGAHIKEALTLAGIPLKEFIWKKEFFQRLSEALRKNLEDAVTNKKGAVIARLQRSLALMEKLRQRFFSPRQPATITLRQATAAR